MFTAVYKNAEGHILIYSFLFYFYINADLRLKVEMMAKITSVYKHIYTCNIHPSIPSYS